MVVHKNSGYNEHIVVLGADSWDYCNTGMVGFAQFKDKAQVMRIVIPILLASILIAMAIGAPIEWVYRCPICKLQQTYGMAGAYKCPNDGNYMLPVYK